MQRIESVNPQAAQGKAKELLDAVKAKLGMVPNLMRVLANAPAALDAYLQFSGKLAEGTLSAKVREQISLTVGQKNECEYCVSAHCAIGKMVGLTAEQINDSRSAKASDPKADAILKFSRKVVELRGHVSDDDVTALRNVGVTNGEITEIVANVSLNIFTNYFNHVAQTEIDFPKVEPLQACSTGCGCS